MAVVREQRPQSPVPLQRVPKELRMVSGNDGCFGLFVSPSPDGLPTTPLSGSPGWLDSCVIGGANERDVTGVVAAVLVVAWHMGGYYLCWGLGGLACWLGWVPSWCPQVLPIP